MTNHTPHPSDRTPWFGPKRVGWGIRPQTWQGWLVIAAFAIILILIGWVATT